MSCRCVQVLTSQSALEAPSAHLAWLPATRASCAPSTPKQRARDTLPAPPRAKGFTKHAGGGSPGPRTWTRRVLLPQPLPASRAAFRSNHRSLLRSASSPSPRGPAPQSSFPGGGPGAYPSTPNPAGSRSPPSPQRASHPQPGLRGAEATSADESRSARGGDSFGRSVPAPSRGGPGRAGRLRRAGPSTAAGFAGARRAPARLASPARWSASVRSLAGTPPSPGPGPPTSARDLLGIVV